MLVNGCLACDELAGKVRAPGGVIYEDQHWMVSHRLGHDAVPGHLILKLKRHCEHLAELTPAEAATLGPMIQKTSSALSKLLNAVKVYAASYGEEVGHIHFFIIPRTADMPAGNMRVLLYLRLHTLLIRCGLKRAATEVERGHIAERVSAEIQRL